MNRTDLARLGRVATCTACGVRHWRPAPGAPGAGLHGAAWQAWHLDSLAAGAPVVCELCHWWALPEWLALVRAVVRAMVADMAAELVA